MAALAIVMRFTFEGVHSWPGAPQTVREKYLAHPHRHLFHVEAVKAVSHAERDIEIIALKNSMQRFCVENLGGPHDHSCETMALTLLTHFGLQRCRVLEDNENGAEVTA